MTERRLNGTSELQGLDLKRLATLVRLKLKQKILKRELPRLIARALIKKLTALGQLRYQSAFLRANEPIIEAYRRRLVQRFNELEKMVLARIGKSKKTTSKHARRKMDPEKWLLDRKLWQQELVTDGAHFTGQALDLGGNAQLEHMGAGISFDQTDPRAIKWVAGNSKNAAFAITQTQFDALSRTLMEGIADGDTIPQLRKRLMDKMDIARRRAELIARTETLKASNRGSLLGMSQSGVVEGKQWLAAYDKRTCPMCAQMDGNTMGPLDAPFIEQGAVMNFDNPGQEFFDEGGTMPEGGVDFKFDYEEIQAPPLHPDCRCTILAVFREGHAKEHWSKRFMANNPNVKLVNFAHIDNKAGKRFTEQMNKLFAQYESKSKKIAFQNGVHMEDNVAWVWPKDARIEFNFDYLGKGQYKNYVTYQANATATRFLATVDEANRLSSVYVHEFAHSIWTKSSRPFLTPAQAIKADEFAPRLAKIKGQYETALAAGDGGHISHYASHNIDEFFAEAFTEYKLSSTPSKWSVRVGKLVEDVFGKGGP